MLNNKVKDKWEYDKTGNLIKSDNLKPCSVCKTLTKYIEFCYEVRCCSEECLKKLDDDYNEAMIRMGAYEESEL